MNKKTYLLSLLLLMFVFTACDETTEAGKFDNWRPRNEAFIDSLANAYAKPGHGGLNEIKPMSNPYVSIFYKDITPSTNVVIDRKPLYTDSVNVYYRGTFIFGEKFDQNFTGANPDPKFDNPFMCSIQPGKANSVIAGWTETLQQMKIGQRWMVYIPWQMGYGSNNRTDANGAVSIPAYSTLIFDMELIGIANKK